VHQIYMLLVGIHIFAAIIGVGPALAFNRVLKTAENMNELKSAYKIIGKLNHFANIGFGLLLLTGLLMGLMNPSLFQMIWYDLSLIIFIILGLYQAIITEPKMKSLLKIAETYDGVDIPQEYKNLSEKKAPYDWLSNTILIIIFILMVFKPW